VECAGTTRRTGGADTASHAGTENAQPPAGSQAVPGPASMC